MKIDRFSKLSKVGEKTNENAIFTVEPCGDMVNGNCEYKLFLSHYLKGMHTYMYIMK